MPSSLSYARQPLDAAASHRPEPPRSARGDDGRRRGPLRPARLVPVRSRIGPQTAARAFQTLDAAVLVILAALASTGSMGGSLPSALAGTAPFLVGAAAAAFGLRAASAYAYNRSEGQGGHLLRVMAAFLAAGFAAATAAWLLTDGRSLGAVLVWTGSAALLVGVLHIGAYDLTRSW